MVSPRPTCASAPADDEGAAVLVEACSAASTGRPAQVTAGDAVQVTGTLFVELASLACAPRKQKSARVIEACVAEP